MAIAGACLADASIFAFAQGQLRAEAVPEVERHLATCADCRSVVAETARFLAGEDGGPLHRTSHLSGSNRAGRIAACTAETTGGASFSDVARRPAGQSLLDARSPGPNAPRALASGTRVSRYVISDVIGSGASGVVYRAYDPELRRNVALKLLRTDWAEQEAGTHDSGGPEATLPGFPAAEPDPRGLASLKARLLREAQVMAQLSHPNVVSVFDVGTYGDQVFVVLELVEGETLGHWLGERSRSWQEIRAAFTDAGKGLAAAHAVQLVHRDFKPANVLVGLDGRVRVTDFGLARPIDFDGSDPYDAAGARGPGKDGREAGRDGGSDVKDAEVPAGGGTRSPLFSMMPTEDGGLAGTPVYMAPEQFAGQRTDARTDQFSFCVALYMALYHRHPYLDLSGTRRLYSLEDLATSVRSGRVHVPVTPDVPCWVFAVLRKGLAVKPQERFASMHALLRELNAAEASRSVRKPRPRSRMAFAAGALAVGAVIVAGLSFRSFLSPERVSSERAAPPSSSLEEEGRRGAAAAAAQGNVAPTSAHAAAASGAGSARLVTTTRAAGTAGQPRTKMAGGSHSSPAPRAGNLAVGKPRKRAPSSRTTRAATTSSSSPSPSPPPQADTRAAAPRYFDDLKDPF